MFRFLTLTLPLTLTLTLSLLALVTPAQGQSEAQGEQADSVNLRPQWTEGQTARYELWNKRTQTATVKFAGRSRKVQTTMVSTGQVSWSVDEVNDDGSSTCTMVMDWMTITLTTNGKTQRNDSRKGQGDTPTMQKFLKAVTGTPITCQVAADGSIDGVDGVSKMQAKLPKRFAKLAPDPRDLIESASGLAVLPHAPKRLEVGDDYDASYKWTHQLGFTDQDWTYTLKSVQPMAGIPVATVTGEGDLDLEVDRGDMPDNAPPIDVDMREGTAQSEVLFDLDRHEAVGRNQTQKETIEINVNLPKGRGKLNRRIDQTIQSQVLRIAEGA